MWLEGYQLDRYRLGRLLGYSGSGAVYLADETRDAASSGSAVQVAVKVLQADTASLFDQEVRVMAQLEHPGILPLLSYGEWQIRDIKVHYLVMPYQQEGSLAQWVKPARGSWPRDGGGLSSRQVASIVLQTASALQHAHDQQVMHQGVKPTNLLIGTIGTTPEASPNVLLADFNMGRFATASAPQYMHGSALYMAPEQWQGQPLLSSDQYALAVMAYELLTGRPPFQGTVAHIMYQHLMLSPMSPCLLVPQLHVDVDRILLKALAKRPEDRFPSIMNFAQVLQMALQTTRPRIYAVRAGSRDMESETGLLVSDMGRAVSQEEPARAVACVSEGEAQTTTLVATREAAFIGNERTPPLAASYHPVTPPFLRSTAEVSGRMWSVQPGMSAQPLQRPLRQTATIVATPRPTRQRVTVLFARWPQQQRATILAGRQPVQQKMITLCERWLLHQKAHVRAALEPLRPGMMLRPRIPVRSNPEVPDLSAVQGPINRRGPKIHRGSLGFHRSKRNILLLLLAAFLLVGSSALFLLAARQQREEEAATQATITAQFATGVAARKQLTATADIATIAVQRAEVTATAKMNGTLQAYATATAQASFAMRARARAAALVKGRVVAITQGTLATQTMQHNAIKPTAHTSPAPGNPVTILGSPSPDTYCQQNEYGSAVTTDGNAYSWACETGAGQPAALSMTDVCRWQFHDPQALDVLVTIGNPDSWECITHAQNLGVLSAVNLSGYCQSLGDNGTSLDGATSYDWHCVTTDGQHQSVDVNAACRWQFNNAQALARPAHAADPNSWECWAGV